MSTIPKRKHVAQPWTLERTPRPDLVPIGFELLAGWIFQARVAMGMSQAGLANAAGVHQSTISRLENGKLPGMTLRKLVVIFALLDGGLRIEDGRPPRRDLFDERQERATTHAAQSDMRLYETGEG